METAWSELDALVQELRRHGENAVADALVDAERYASTSGEILAGIGLVLKQHAGLRAGLGDSGRAAWDGVEAAVAGGCLGSRWMRVFARLLRR